MTEQNANQLNQESYFHKSVEEVKEFQDSFLDDKEKAYRDYELLPSSEIDSDIMLLRAQKSYREVYAIARKELIKAENNLQKLQAQLSSAREVIKYYGQSYVTVADPWDEYGQSSEGGRRARSWLKENGGV